MIIHSKFKDYYDGMAYLGHDPTLNYPRETREVDTTVIPSRPNLQYSFTFRKATYKGSKKRWNQNVQHYIRDSDGVVWYQDVVYVIFCGELYTGVLMHDELYTKKKFFWGQADFEDYIGRNYDLESTRETWRGSWNPGKDHVDAWTQTLSRETIEWLIAEKIVTLTMVPTPLTWRQGKYWSNTTNYRFREPQKEVWQVDTPLTNLEFYKAVPMEQAWQKIDMWLSGALSHDSPPLIQLTDKSLHAKHGMDKWSFRKMPG